METKKIFLVLIIIFFIFGLVTSGIIGYSLGLKKVKFVTEIPEILPKEIFMRAGKVTKIEGNIVYLEAEVITGEIDSKTGEPKIETLKVIVDENTKFNFPLSPGEETHVEARFEDIKVGSGLYVVSSENIKNKKEFTAQEITILEYEQT